MTEITTCNSIATLGILPQVESDIEMSERETKTIYDKWVFNGDLMWARQRGDGRRTYVLQAEWLYNRRSSNDKLSTGSLGTAARLLHPRRPTLVSTRPGRGTSLQPARPVPRPRWGPCGQMDATGALNTGRRGRSSAPSSSSSSVLALRYRRSMSVSSEICLALRICRIGI